ncbi:hypothetical protein GGI06_005798, partial [Coemansia sp. S85]
MYDYVRRQQELQSSMFSSKTFQWMDHGNAASNSVREPGWVKVYAKDLPTDPLAYSSSSLFTAPRATPNAFQRTAANLSPHRSLFTFRRQRQNSDAATRPPSGISSAFQQRRRGFTAPPGSQPSFDGIPATLRGAHHHLANGSRRDMPASHKDTVDPQRLSSAQIRHVGPSYNTRPRASRSRGSARRPQPRRPPPPPSAELGAVPKSRALPRSPLANPLVITNTAATERVEVVPDKPTSSQSDSMSSDEDILKCGLCHRYKGADWIVHCDAGHTMCFGCIQNH